MIKSEIHNLLESKYDEFCRPEFIESDPISIPHLFDDPRDIEIAGFFAATIAWGQRPTIIKNARRLMKLMDDSPFEFITQHRSKDLKRFDGFVHRTFNADDVRAFCISLKDMYEEHPSLENHFTSGLGESNENVGKAISHFKKRFFQNSESSRTLKHVSDPAKGSAAKRINMYLRWMVRPNDRGVDFGIWKNIPTSLLSCPLDVHSGRVARKLGLLSRKQDDWKAVAELDSSLRALDSNDPVKYDYSLFGLGVFEGF